MIFFFGPYVDYVVPPPFILGGTFRQRMNEIGASKFDPYAMLWRNWSSIQAEKAIYGWLFYQHNNQHSRDST